MKICVTANGEGLDSEVDPRFGRCRYFVIYDFETESVESIPNVALEASGGAGIKASEALAKAGVDILLTGRLGPNAFSIFTEAQIDIETGAKGTVREAIAQHEAGVLELIQGPNSVPHSGVKKGGGARKKRVNELQSSRLEQ
ncbi:MAG: NifB/NifX family molybdenum-iron cluster-binding protein [Methanosarcina sp.]